MTPRTHETPEDRQAEIKPTPPDSTNDKLDDTKVRTITFIYSHFFTYFVIGLISLSVAIAVTRPTLFATVWPNKNADKCWQIHDYLDYSSQYAALIGSILAVAGITINNSNYIAELLTKLLSKPLPSIIFAALQLLNCIIIFSIFMLIFKAQEINWIPLIIGLGFNLIAITSPLMLVFLVQRLVKRNVMKRIEIIDNYISKLESKFLDARSTSTGLGSRHRHPRDAFPEDKPFRFMARILRRSNSSSIPFWMASSVVCATLIGATIFTAHLIYKENYPYRSIVSGISATSVPSIFISLPLLIALGLTRMTYKEFLLQPCERNTLIAVSVISLFIVEILIVRAAWSGLLEYTSAPLKAVAAITAIFIFSSSFMLSTLSILCERGNWDGIFYPSNKFAKQTYERLQAERQDLINVCNFT
ncbi:hypothetical protein [Actinomyces sp. HMT 175]|jgi:membrane protein|uniref:hypothetical protein n=1 Tax=Actinomyces sp. HMT 175 TaxID=2789425 RepID=UPI0019179768|nr:hypothetical protein [Actinomyces sp. HMT 175]QQQ60224.1 hypothetical protein JJJ14_05400 [Actinomyces sp. HMT 175]